MNDLDAYNNQFSFLIYDIFRGLRHNGERLLCELGLTVAQWRAISHLSRMPGCRQNELAEALQIRPMSLMPVIDKLEQLGLVRRDKDTQDRRAVSLHLTEQARPILSQLEQIRKQLTDKALSHLSPEERDTFLHHLLTVRDVLHPSHSE